MFRPYLVFHRPQSWSFLNLTMQDKKVLHPHWNPVLLSQFQLSVKLPEKINCEYVHWRRNPNRLMLLTCQNDLSNNPATENAQHTWLNSENRSVWFCFQGLNPKLKFWYRIGFTVLTFCIELQNSRKHFNVYGNKKMVVSAWLGYRKTDDCKRSLFSSAKLLWFKYLMKRVTLQVVLVTTDHKTVSQLLLIHQKIDSIQHVELQTP